MKAELAIGVDLGATKIATALVSRAGEVLQSRQTATLAASGAGAVCDRIAAEVRALIDAAPDPSAVLGIGIGSPGLIDGSSGIVRVAVNLNWHDVPLAQEVANRVGGMHVFVENDANANAVGEGYFGSAVGSRHYILLTIGSGLGSGVVSHGRLITGPRSMAADLGHYSIDPDHGRPCVCGGRGCAETVASGPGLIAVTRSMLETRPYASALAHIPDLTPDRILAAARSADSTALAAFAVMGRAVGEIAAVASAVIDPDVIVIGGGLGVAAFDLVHPLAAQEMARRLSPVAHVPAIRPATLVSPAVGSAGLVWSRLSPDKEPS
jgi:glucokinase